LASTSAACRTRHRRVRRLMAARVAVAATIAIVLLNVLLIGNLLS
jgi:hypothetical protein